VYRKMKVEKEEDHCQSLNTIWLWLRCAWGNAGYGSEARGRAKITQRRPDVPIQYCLSALDHHIDNKQSYTPTLGSKSPGA
jgi:hypothetical protein